MTLIFVVWILASGCLLALLKMVGCNVIRELAFSIRSHFPLTYGNWLFLGCPPNEINELNF